MEIYVEYAFLENFLFDGVLLYLAFKASKTPIKKLGWFCSACFGGIFALVFPLLNFQKGIGYLLKIFVGLLLCLFPFPALQTKKDRGRYALTVVFFFAFSFFFGGTLLALFQEFFQSKVPSLLVMCGFAVLSVCSCIFVEKVYQKRMIFRFLYDCRVKYKGKNIEIRGFLDSGTLAQKNGLPVCFLSPNVFYELIGKEILKEEGQVCDEIHIQTLGGVKKMKVFKGVLEMKVGNTIRKKEVYFANSKNMLSRGYEMIIGSCVLDGETDKEEWV